MSVTLSDNGVIVLHGVCPIEDAEVLLRHLTSIAGGTVDWSLCEQAHTAVIQVLMAAETSIVGIPTDDFLRRHLPALGKA